MRSFVVICLLFNCNLSGIAQDSITYFFHGKVLDLERKFPVSGAVVSIECQGKQRVTTISDESGIYAFRFTCEASSKYLYLEADADDYSSGIYKCELQGDTLIEFNIDLTPAVICIDTIFPKHFKFGQNSSSMHPDDSLALVMAFSSAEIKNYLKKFSYSIVVRRSTFESDQLALDRGKAILRLLVQMGIFEDQISIENRAVEDFFYCHYCEGCVYEYLVGQGITITQAIIDDTADPIRKEELESMRRIAQIEMNKRE